MPSVTAEQEARRISATDDDAEKVRRFRGAALPFLDEVHALAHHLLGDATDAEDAVQECYLRALKYVDSYRGPAMKPWLFAILRNVCRDEFQRRASSPIGAIEDMPESAEQIPLWNEAQETPEAQMLRTHNAAAIRRLVSALGEPLRETFVLREINDLSYREIADAVGAPVGTVMSRLARARHAAVSVDRGRGAADMTCDTEVKKDDELGWFEHGSTIIVLTPDRLEFRPNVREGARIEAGQPLLRKPQ